MFLRVSAVSARPFQSVEGIDKLSPYAPHSMSSTRRGLLYACPPEREKDTVTDVNLPLETRLDDHVLAVVPVTRLLRRLHHIALKLLAIAPQWVFLDGLEHIVGDGTIFHTVDVQFGVTLPRLARLKEEDGGLVYSLGDIEMFGILEGRTEPFARGGKTIVVPRTVAKSRSRDMVPEWQASKAT